MRNPGEYIVTSAAAAFEQELRHELRTKLMALAQAEVEYTIDEVVKRMNTTTRCHENTLGFRFDVEFAHRSIK
jgi:uncharacterized OsmC-like protein